MLYHVGLIHILSCEISPGYSLIFQPMGCCSLGNYGVGNFSILEVIKHGNGKSPRFISYIVKMNKLYISVFASFFLYISYDPIIFPWEAIVPGFPSHPSVPPRCKSRLGNAEFSEIYPVGTCCFLGIPHPATWICHVEGWIHGNVQGLLFVRLIIKSLSRMFQQHSRKCLQGFKGTTNSNLHPYSEIH